VRVDCVDMSTALTRIEELVDRGGPHQVATVNPEFIMRAQKDLEFARVLSQADLCLADGVGVVWAARRQGCDLPGPVAGVDLVHPIAAMCAKRSLRLFLLGAAPGVAADLAARLRSAYDGLEVSAHSGGPEPSHDVETLHRIHDHLADLVLVAFGAPAQEMWIDRMKNRLGASVAMGVGGAFDYLTDRVPRAPAWMREARLEWLARLVRQPWRIRRMAVLPVYALKVMRSPK
jgi:N-acetylglucosaminyldiphosphoundecaprenol N-acetyl-beta-D-mannosaminyltransferase